MSRAENVDALVHDEWLSRVMGAPAYRVDLRAGDPCARLASHQKSHAASFYYAKIDTSDIAAARTLARAGFYVADVNMTFEAAPGAVEAACGPARGSRVEPVDEASAPAVLDIAATCFRYNRFHLDPLIPRPVADRIKRGWIQSYVDGVRGDRLFVAFDHDRPAGFLAALTAQDADARVARIDLVGVATASQRRGIGHALVGAFARHYADRDWLRVGTQAANIPSIRLYEKLGFTIRETTYVLHSHGAPPSS